MLRARRHRPRARDRPRVRARDRSIRRGFVPRIRIRTPDARANAKSTRATRARIPHTHTHHRRATSRSRPNDSRLATRASTSPVPIARVHHVGTRLVSPHHTHRSRVDFSTTTTLVHHRSITHTTHTRPASACTHEDTSTDHDSSSVIHTSTRTRSPPWKIQKSIRGRAVDPPRRARARSSSTASSSRVVRARGWVKKRKRDARKCMNRMNANARTRDGTRARQ